MSDDATGETCGLIDFVEAPIRGKLRENCVWQDNCQPCQTLRERLAEASRWVGLPPMRDENFAEMKWPTDEELAASPEARAAARRMFDLMRKRIASDSQGIANLFDGEMNKVADKMECAVKAEQEMGQWREVCERVYALFPTATKLEVEPAMLLGFMIGIQCRLEQAEKWKPSFPT